MKKAGSNTDLFSVVVRLSLNLRPQHQKREWIRRSDQHIAIEQQRDRGMRLPLIFRHDAFPLFLRPGGQHRFRGIVHRVGKPVAKFSI
jgi:hypothetical protein